MNVKTILLLALATLVLLTSASAFAQKFEISPHVGGQINGGLDLSTTLFHRIEVGNSVNYGVSVGYLLGEHYGIEFQWNRNHADTTAQSNVLGNSIKVFTLKQDQYMGNFLLHLTPRETKLRPFVFFGLGANALDPDRSGVKGATKFVFAFGGGAKYNVSKHFGLRGQLKYAPTYITTTSGGYWCDPFWGGCWVVGNDHYLHEFDVSGGITFRF